MIHRKICKWYDVCPLKLFYIRKRIEKKWIEDYCFGNFLECVRYKMEEAGLRHFDNMMPDGTIDEKLK